MVFGVSAGNRSSDAYLAQIKANQYYGKEWLEQGGNL